MKKPLTKKELAERPSITITTRDDRGIWSCCQNCKKFAHVWIYSFPSLFDKLKKGEPKTKKDSIDIKRVLHARHGYKLEKDGEWLDEYYCPSNACQEVLAQIKLKREAKSNALQRSFGGY